MCTSTPSPSPSHPPSSSPSHKGEEKENSISPSPPPSSSPSPHKGEEKENSISPSPPHSSSPSMPSPPISSLLFSLFLPISSYFSRVTEIRHAIYSLLSYVCAFTWVRGEEEIPSLVLSHAIDFLRVQAFSPLPNRRN